MSEIQPWVGVGGAAPLVVPPIASDFNRYNNGTMVPYYGNKNMRGDVKIVPLSDHHMMKRPTGTRIVATNMPTDKFKFPNLVVGYQRNPNHAIQSSTYTKYTPQEWFQKQVKFYNEADLNRHYSERLRNNTVRVIREAEDKIQQGQRDTGRKLGERISDVMFWRNEVAAEMEKIIIENGRLHDCKRLLERALRDTEGPLRVAEECLYHRQSRKGTELVHDEVEQTLLREIENLKNSQKKLEMCLDKCKDQLRNGRAAQNQLELDLKNKEGALGIDAVCHQLNNFSRGLQYCSGIEKFDACAIEPESWAEAANRIVQKSQTERAKSCQMRSDTEAMINRVAQDMWDSWTNTNNALSRRSAEMLEAKNMLKQHLHKVQQEIFDVEKNLELTRKAIADKSSAIKVAHTRLEARLHRPELELCRDYAQLSLQKEIEEITRQVERMYKMLKELENQHQRLLRTRNEMEHDLAIKIDAIYIDKEKVAGLRRAYPVNALFRF